MVFLRAACLIFGLVVFIGRARHKGLNYPLDTKFLTTSQQKGQQHDEQDGRLK